MIIPIILSIILILSAILIYLVLKRKRTDAEIAATNLAKAKAEKEEADEALKKVLAEADEAIKKTEDAKNEALKKEQEKDAADKEALKKEQEKDAADEEALKKKQEKDAADEVANNEKKILDKFADKLKKVANKAKEATEALKKAEEDKQRQRDEKKAYLTTNYLPHYFIDDNTSTGTCPTHIDPCISTSDSHIMQRCVDQQSCAGFIRVKKGDKYIFTAVRDIPVKSKFNSKNSKTVAYKKK
jgi:chemotaxis protein histidine kinase CheA